MNNNENEELIQGILANNGNKLITASNFLRDDSETSFEELTSNLSGIFNLQHKNQQSKNRVVESRAATVEPMTDDNHSALSTERANRLGLKKANHVPFLDEDL